MLSNRGVFTSLVSLFLLGQHSLELLKEGEHFFLRAFSSGQPVNLPALMERYRTADWLVQFLGNRSGPYAIALSQLATVKSILKADLDKQLAITIAPEADAMLEVAQPAGFQLAWRWSYSRDGLVPESNATYYGDGWFLQDERYWHMDGLLPDDAEWLDKSLICGQEILGFLGDVLPAWQERGLPALSRVNLNEDPVLNLVVKKIDHELITVAVSWDEPSALIFSPSGLPGHVLTGHSIRPGVPLERIACWLADDEQSIDLKGEDIPRFLQALGPALVCLGEGREKVESIHMLHSEPVELVLDVRCEQVNGLGSVQAVPVACCGDLCMKAEALSQCMDEETEFLRVRNGWVPATAVTAAGIGRFGRALDGSALGPLTLTPEEIMGRTSSRLTGPWSRINFPSILLPVGETPEENARLHLDFLLQYGISGGIVGPVRQFGRQLLSTLAGFTMANSDSRVLVIGTKTSLAVAAKGMGEAVAARFDGGISDPAIDHINGLVLATPKALDIRPELSKQEWDILALLDADSLVKSRTTKLFRLLCSLHKEITLGLFALPDFYRNSGRGSALSQVFELTDYGSLGQLWRYVVRNLQGKFPVFPKSIWPQQKELPGTLAEFAFGGMQGAAVPIPERSYYSYMPSVPRQQIEKFITTARQLANQDVTRTDYQFMTYYQPTYDYMTPDQLNWYLYWRSQVRQGRYTDTGMAYIMLHAYELVNSIGVADVVDGYEQLRRLWSNYRRQFPLLDATLLGWASDYLLVNGCPRDPLEIYQEAAETGASAQYTDLLLERYLGTGVGNVPLFLWEQLSDYQVRSSRFYGDGYASALKECIPLILQTVDQRLQARTGRGIFTTWRPRKYELIMHVPFQSAIYASEPRPIRLGTYLPYTKHTPLRHFITSVLKHSENRLRELKQYRGRLRGYTLDAWVGAIVDEVIFSGSGRMTQSPKVHVDLDKVKQLTKESEKVRELLLKDLSQPGETLPSTMKPVEPKTEEELLSLLSADERSLLETLALYDGAVPDDILREQLAGELLEPLVDHINEVFLIHTGGLLITTVDGARLIVETQREVLEHLLPVLHVKSAAKRGEDWLASFPDEWIAFFSDLSDAQWAALAICAGQEPQPALRQMAERLGTMPELIIDELNDIALDAIGDIVVHPGPELEEEYMPMVRQALRARGEVV